MRCNATFGFALDLKLLKVEQDLVALLDVYEPVALLGSAISARRILFWVARAGKDPVGLASNVPTAFCSKKNVSSSK